MSKQEEMLVATAVMHFEAFDPAKMKEDSQDLWRNEGVRYSEKRRQGQGHISRYV